MRNLEQPSDVSSNTHYRTHLFCSVYLVEIGTPTLALTLDYAGAVQFPSARPAAARSHQSLDFFRGELGVFSMGPKRAFRSTKPG